MSQISIPSTAGGTVVNSITAIDGIAASASTGAVTLSLFVPLFQVEVAGGAIPDLTGNGTSATVIFNFVRVQNGSGYSTSTGIFTAPIAGNYLFAHHICLSNLSAPFSEGRIELQTSVGTYVFNDCNPGAMFSAIDDVGRLGLAGSIIVPLAVGGTAKVNVYVDGGSQTIGVGDAVNADTFWSGHFIST